MRLRRFKQMLAALLAYALAFCLCGCSGDAEAGLRIRILKIGKADAIILRTASGAVLIDTGEKEDGGEILEKAAAQGIKHFDYLILTHYDKDHVGGAAEVIAGIEIGEIIEPGYEKDSEVFRAFAAAAEQAGVKRTVPETDRSLSLDGVTYTIMMPKRNVYANENDQSIAVRAEWGEYSALFAGDALDERTGELIAQGGISADVLKVPHHGSFEEGSEAFFEAADPDYAVITCSKKNPPDAQTIACLQRLGSRVLLTSDGDIEIIFTENGITAVQ